MLRKSDTWDKSFDKKREPESNEYISLTEKYLNFAKKVPWFWKKNLFACIFGFNFHLKFRVKSIFQRKHQNFPLSGPSFVCRTWNVYWIAPIPGNLPCPKKFLILRPPFHEQQAHQVFRSNFVNSRIFLLL